MAQIKYNSHDTQSYELKETQRDADHSKREKGVRLGGGRETEGEIYADTQTYSQVRKIMASSCNADPLSGSG